MITPEEILDDAIDALTASASEARHRSVTCRAYYAAYHFVKNHACCAKFLAQNPTHTQGLHKRLINWLYTSKEPNVLVVATKLDSLFDSRVRADYHIGISFGHHWSNDAIDKASEIISVDLGAYDAKLDVRA